ncbi:nucleotidyltransferase domain-containing protein [Butyricimonas paravirosa]|uniref:nucleotidyltransferase domain-containing protein n=2 Tax=Butyricimonas TaxID=574697 RepID=UPI00242D5923|nr:nucleotidyltransferase domain-containing protein [Butyricimonas paravirosa]
MAVESGAGAAKGGGRVFYGNLSLSEIERIENAATRIGKEIHLVGSRAKGTANAYSDWDYVIEGITNKNWKKIKNSLPGAKSFLDNTPRRIDLFKVPLDVTKPYITFYPKKR